jgi:hypothetical protein
MPLFQFPLKTYFRKVTYFFEDASSRKFKDPELNGATEALTSDVPMTSILRSEK